MVENSCGGQGCNVPEHEKRLGTNNIIVDEEAMTVLLSGPTVISDLVYTLETNFGEKWVDFQIKHPNEYVTYRIAN